MPWVKLDDQFPFNRKAILAGKDGRALYVTALCWTAGQLTDGLIDNAVVPMLAALSEVADAGEATERLVSAGLWEPVDGGYEIHDFHDYNPSSDDVRKMREARAEAGRRGGHSKAASKSLANDVAKEKQNPAPSPSPSPSPKAAAAAPESDGYAKTLSEYGIILNGSIQSDMWHELSETAGKTLFKQALDEAARAGPGVPTFRYVDAIIKRCMRDGVTPGARRDGNGSRASPSPPAKPAPTTWRNPISGKVESI